MYSSWQGWFWILGLVNIIWLLGLTFLAWQNNLFMRRITSHGGTFKNKMDEVLTSFEGLEDFKKSSLSNVSQVGLKRYNPYHDTGGDQSFSLALLDGRGDGVVITSLHSRAGTRIFAKPVKEGQQEKFEFSKEEQEVINDAKHF